MLINSEVSNGLIYVEITTISLETRTLFAVWYNNTTKPSNNNRFIQQIVDDESEIRNICDNARNQLKVPQWRQLIIK